MMKLMLKSWQNKNTVVISNRLRIWRSQRAAAQQLGHVEALLGNDPGLPTNQVQSWLGENIGFVQPGAISG